MSNATNQPFLTNILRGFNGENPNSGDDTYGLHEVEVQQGLVLLQELVHDGDFWPGFDQVRRLLIQAILWEEALSGHDKGRLVLMCTSPTVTMVDVIRAASQIQAARAVSARFDQWYFEEAETTTEP
jgi:hypothetical protein